MNCQAIQNLLYIQEDPSRPLAEIETHLEACPTCRQWQRRLVQIEKNVSLLQLPPSTTMREAVGRFLAAPAVPRKTAKKVSRRRRVAMSQLAPISQWRWPNFTPAQRWSLLGSMAATFLLVVLGSWAFRSSRPGSEVVAVKRLLAPDPFLTSLVNVDLHLAVARTPRERVETLARLADGLQEQTRWALGGVPEDDLNQLAGLYEQVLREGVVPSAQRIGEADRARVLQPIVDSLERTVRAADSLAQHVPESAAEPLVSISRAAKDADERLLALWPGRLEVGEVQDSAALPPDPERLRELRRNRRLIQQLVKGSLQLAGQDDCLVRATCCNGLARHLAGEIKEAADHQENNRVAELGDHLHNLMRGGVARNLNTIPLDSAEPRIMDVCDEAKGIIDPLEELFQNLAETDPDNLGRVFQSYQAARAEIDQVVKSRAKS
jgi:hypothetical protein